ncbi:MAG: DinB family protein [Gemmatimonadaceae bacterium]|nr:DinB family protein [Gemmatimonadaceae bacterium]
MPTYPPLDLVLPRPAADEFAPYYQGYLAAVDSERIGAQLLAQRDAVSRLLGPLDDTTAQHRYAPGKWSVKEVCGHLVDTERVFAYRLLRIARGDTTPLPGFDEDVFVAHGGFDARPIAALADEFRTTRAATITMIRGFDAAVWTRRGTASGQPVSANALAWLLVGHVAHHVRLLHERYGIAPLVTVDARD